MNSTKPLGRAQHSCTPDLTNLWLSTASSGKSCGALMGDATVNPWGLFERLLPLCPSPAVGDPFGHRIDPFVEMHRPAAAIRPG